MGEPRKARVPKDQQPEPEPAGPQVLKVPLTIEWSANIRFLCEKAGITQREAIGILAEGCGKAITSDGLAKAIVTRKIAALQSLLGRPAPALEPMPHIVEPGGEELPEEWEQARELALEGEFKEP